MADEIDKHEDSSPAEQASPGRRGFLKAAPLAIGGAIGAVLVYPIVRYVLFPVGRKTVSEAAEPIDVLAEADLDKGGAPVQVALVGEGVRNAWSVSDRVALGSAWVRKSSDGEVQALSAACPHLGCAIDYDGGNDEYRCPCHRSAFALDGGKKSGPSKRGLDPLPTEVTDDGRVRVTFVRFKQDVPEREPV
ncbi:MAG: Rieske 2Fe-2S domain-containing protein [Deltaproteobacteria bacterium]|nr:Rieske 2Fe-2S domain-containing protein [Deltaproteobacteria bacterium]